MGLTPGRISTSNNITSNSVSSQTQPLYGVVYEVITDTGSDTAKSKGLDTAASIGCIRFRLLSDNSTNMNTNEQLPVAFPFDKNSITLPTKNEIIIIHSFGGNYHYSRVGGGITPNLNALTSLISNQLDNEIKLDSSNDAATYQNVSSTGIVRTNKNSGKSDFDGYGEYFTDNSNIHKLKLYEGDTLLESRFGQSIRFSGYNNSENKFAPTITIRNGENSDSLESEIGTSTEENINNDGNIIFLGSGEKLLEYTLPIENKKESFSDYPNELKGNQILLNSDRIILSAKSQEMIFASKLNMGFITDNQFSIDASRGIDITVDDEIDINTNDFDFNINIGNAIINLGTDGEMEKAPKGDTLVKLLGELIDLISKQQYATPAGLTSVGPLNVALFTTLKNKLESMLSNNVKLK